MARPCRLTAPPVGCWWACKRQYPPGHQGVSNRRIFRPASPLRIVTMLGSTGVQQRPQPLPGLFRSSENQQRLRWCRCTLFCSKNSFLGQRITCHFYIIQENFDPLWSHPVDVIKFLWVPPGEQETLTWQWQHLLFSIKSFTPFLASLALCCRRIKIWMLRHSAHSGKSMKIIENQDDPTINWGDITSHLNHFTVKMPINRRPANCEVHGSISLELPSKKQPKA